MKYYISRIRISSYYIENYIFEKFIFLYAPIKSHIGIKKIKIIIIYLFEVFSSLSRVASATDSNNSLIPISFNADIGLINIPFISLANSFPSSSETLSLSFLSDLFSTSAITNFYYLYIIIFLTCIFR